MMGGKRCRIQGFTLIEVVVVIAILGVITTTASVALVKVLGLWRQARTASFIDENTRQVMLDLSRELRSTGALLAPPGVPLAKTKGGLPSHILVYDLGEGLWCTVRLDTAGEEPAGLVKEIRSGLQASEAVAREVLIPEAVGFKVTYTARGQDRDTEVQHPGAVGVTVWVEGMQRGRGPRAYATAVSIPRLLWKTGT
jgi:prepilin-type N-terminal cleavage/methylation domain-containing protein